MALWRLQTTAPSFDGENKRTKPPPQTQKLSKSPNVIRWPKRVPGGCIGISYAAFRANFKKKI